MADAQDFPSEVEGHPSAIGEYTVDAAMGQGRFGPLYHARAADGLSVVIRTFAQPFTEAQQQKFLTALAALCQSPLDHPSIARPITSGLHNGRPYLVHTYLPGTALADYVVVAGRPTLANIIRRLTYLAGALDFAAAAGVFHGALGPHDVIFSVDNAGVSGLGLVQALESAGVDGFHARRDHDVVALMGMARDLLGDAVTPAVTAVLSSSTPATALDFAAALHSTLESDPPAPVAQHVDADVDLRRAPPPDVHDTPHHAEALDIPLREHASSHVPTHTLFGVTDTPAHVPAPRERRRSWGWLITATVALALGVFTGFAGGFFVGQDEPSAPVVVSKPQPVQETGPPQPEPTNGRVFTDAPVDEAPKVATAAPDTQTPSQPAPPAASPTTTPPAATDHQARQVPAAPAPSGPAAMRVESLPAGAQVFVDGRSVGYAPLVVGELTPGTHSVRMQLPGYRPWVSAVTLGPGARERVAASLEQ